MSREATQFKKGERKVGRKKGQLNKRSEIVKQKGEELGIDAAEILFYIAANKWKELGYDSKTTMGYTKNGQSYEMQTIPIDIRYQAAAKLCDFIYPKLKVVDADIRHEGSKQFVLELSSKNG